MFVAAEKLHAREALAYGLVDAIADDPLAAALDGLIGTFRLHHASGILPELHVVALLSLLDAEFAPSSGPEAGANRGRCALADAERRSGDWLICKPGCTPCCIGVFAIDQLDALRLHEGLAALDATDPERAARVRERARESWRGSRPSSPATSQTGVLGDDDEAGTRFEEFANYEPCPALDPERGTCDLYQWRPITCRVFGPPVRSDGGLGVCELCYHGASPEEIEACEINLDEANALQAELVGKLEQSGNTGRTIVAFALGGEATLPGR